MCEECSEAGRIDPARRKTNTMKLVELLQNKSVQELLSEGGSLRDLGQKLGVSHATIANWVRSLEVVEYQRYLDPDGKWLWSQPDIEPRKVGDVFRYVQADKHVAWFHVIKVEQGTVTVRQL